MITRSNTRAPRNGYDLPVYGLDNGLFYVIHIPAIACILTSLCCVVTAITVSFRRGSRRSFFSWTKCDRFVVYLAICDGLFNVVHMCDHLQMTFTKNHVYPKELCQFNAFFQIEFITAQNLMVNIVATNIFMLMYFNKQLKFGRCDWKLLVWTFGVPLMAAVVSTALGLLGPTGAFCNFDGVKGSVGSLCVITVPLLVIFVLNTGLYTFTWTKIRREATRLGENLGQYSSSRKASVRAARNMSLFVLAFFIQWCAAALYSAWGLFGDVPVVIFHMVTIFPNIGGVLNLMVYVIVHRKDLGGLKGQETLSYNGQVKSTDTRIKGNNLDMTEDNTPTE